MNDDLWMIKIGILLGQRHSDLPEFEELKEITAYMRHFYDIVIPTGMEYDKVYKLVKEGLTKEKFFDCTEWNNEERYNRAMSIVG